MNCSGSDLSVSGHFMRDSGIDYRCNSFFYNKSCIDSKTDSLEVPVRNDEVRVPVDGNFCHLRTCTQSVLIAACSDKSCYGRSRDHCHTADTEGLCDGTVSHLRARVFSVVSCEVESLRSIHRSVKPLISHARDPDTEFVSVPAHCCYDCSLLDRPCRIHYSLSCGHHDVQEELVCIGKELDDIVAVLLVHLHLRDGRRYFF